jgi:hypothetical protein
VTSLADLEALKGIYSEAELKWVWNFLKRLHPDEYESLKQVVKVT